MSPFFIRAATRLNSASASGGGTDVLYSTTSMPNFGACFLTSATSASPISGSMKPSVKMPTFLNLGFISLKNPMLRSTVSETFVATPVALLPVMESRYEDYRNVALIFLCFSDRDLCLMFKGRIDHIHTLTDHSVHSCGELLDHCRVRGDPNHVIPHVHSLPIPKFFHLLLERNNGVGLLREL